MLKAAKAYLTTQVSTASNGDLLLMLYDTAIKHLTQAIVLMRQGDVAGKGVLITKAIAIVSELQECLNKERGGEISKNLFNLYFYCNTRLLSANLKMKPELVEEVIAILSGLRQAFAQIMPSREGVASLAQTGAPQAQDKSEEPVRVCPPAAETPSTETPAAMASATPPPGDAPAEPAPAPEPAHAHVNPLRLRAASAYATSR